MKIKPLWNLVVVEPLKIERITESNIVLPEGGGEDDGPHVVIARIVEVGPGRQLAGGDHMTIPFEPGDYVMLSGRTRGIPLAYTGLKLAGPDSDGGPRPSLVLMAAEDIKAVIELAPGEELPLEGKLKFTG